MDSIHTVIDAIVGVLKTFSIADLLDIAILSYIIYKGIKIVRETRAQQLVKGLLLLGVIFLASVLFHLSAMEFLLKNLFSIGAIALIIVFQPELRRILDKVGRTKVRDLSMFNFSADHIEQIRRIWSGAIAEIGKACRELAETKTGALIVIERQTKLGEQIATGVRVDAQISSELLENLFFHNSPLHDGAVIVRDGRIHSASCFLPKPVKEENIARNFGARHRAAIGMSENADAIIIVVSEETGKISVAMDGELFVGYTQEELEHLLKSKLIPEKPEETKENKSAFWKVKRK